MYPLYRKHHQGTCWFVDESYSSPGQSNDIQFYALSSAKVAINVSVKVKWQLISHQSAQLAELVYSTNTQGEFRVSVTQSFTPEAIIRWITVSVVLLWVLRHPQMKKRIPLFLSFVVTLWFCQQGCDCEKKVLIMVLTVIKQNWPFNSLPLILNELRLETNYELMIWSLRT